MTRPTARRLPRPLALLLLLALLLPAAALGAQAPEPSAAAEMIRAGMLQAQLSLSDDPTAARSALAAARATYESALAGSFAASAPEADGRARAGLAEAEGAAAAGDGPALAAARAAVWTALLAGGYQLTALELGRGDAPAAQGWLALREFRRATRFSRPAADAALAVDALAAGKLGPAEAQAAAEADLLDTYQARLSAALAELADPQTQGFALRRGELAGLAAGYLELLAPAYSAQRGEPALAALRGYAGALLAAARAGAGIDAALAPIDAALAGFRAAPLSPAEQQRRAGQLLRFLALVPVEYGRGVQAGRVTSDLEIREASTFYGGATAAFADLRDILAERDEAASAQIADQLAALGRDLAAAGPAGAPDPARIQARADDLAGLLAAAMPAEWQQRSSAADFDVIATALDQMERAAAAGSYDLAESARLEAYAILESGPEAKLIVFAPQFKPLLEDLFWYGQGDPQGLAHLIAERAPASAIRASRQALSRQLVAAEQALGGGNSAPATVATNAAVIVFREGLEAVLILASLMGSLKIGEQRRLRRPLWVGTGLAFAASALTWLAAGTALTALARYGERLEAVVSLIAVAMLLLITNWFFHDVYWKGWMAGFHQQKRRIIGGSAGQWLGLVLLGFSSIYREGFETVLFLQALVLESGAATVLAGVAAGLAGTLLVGLAVFGMQARLPHKKMLIVTGVLIGAVLLQMVGNTVHVMQVVGWLPIHPIRWLSLPYWVGFWFGFYATWEGIIIQLAAAVFVIGSYFLAEHMQRRELRAVLRRQAAA